MRALDAFLDATDADLAAWMRLHVAAPDTMVDRIVPASTLDDRARVAAAIGMDDAAAIITEPFRQWVIESRFAGPRPCWEAAGAQIVDDVAPFELAKLRLLNASHSTLAYMGLQLGYAHVHEAIADPRLRAFVLRQMRDEAVPCLAAAPGLDPDAYIDAILDRFANADLHHRLDQIAMDGSQKLQQRWIGTVETRLARGLESPCHLMSLAAWIAYTAETCVAGDPLLARYRAIWAETGGDPELVIAHFISNLSIFPPRVQQSPMCVATLIHALAIWRQSGPDAAIGTITA
jgi:fructuronate reductase